MAQFTTLNLTGERVLVKGTDSLGTEGSVVVDAAQWNEVKRHQQVAAAGEVFDTEVEKFFAPLLAAAEAHGEAAAKPELDPKSYVVIHEGVDEVKGKERVVMKLSDDSLVLRLIEDGDVDRLVWVGDSIEVIA